MNKNSRTKVRTHLHKVTCCCCGKKERIEIDDKGQIIASGWRYFGKIDINVCQTSKYFYRLKRGKTLMDKDCFTRERNECYNPKAKRRLVEYWECGQCENENCNGGKKS